MERYMMVKQYMGRLQGQFCAFLVHATGDSKHLLFTPCDPQGNPGTVSFPVARANLRRGWRKLLY